MNTNSYFDRVAPDWDKMRKKFFPNKLRHLAISEANIKKDSIVVDLGAGTGYNTEALLKLPIEILAVDQSSGMIDIMKKKFKNATQIQYILTDSDKIPIGDSSVDVVLANMFLHHVNNPYFVVREIYRILKPGGRLVITDLDRHTHEFLVKEHFDRWMGFDREDICDWFAMAGFNQIKVDCADSECNAESKDDDVANIKIFIAKGTKLPI